MRKSCRNENLNCTVMKIWSLRTAEIKVQRLVGLGSLHSMNLGKIFDLKIVEKRSSNTLLPFFHKNVEKLGYVVSGR